MKHTAHQTIALLLFAFCLTSMTAMGQEDYNAAKKHFKRSIRSDKLGDRRSGIRRLRAAGDARGVKDMLVQLHKARKEAAKLDKKSKPTLKKLAKLRGEFDKRLSAYLKRNPGSPTYPKGLVGQIPEKIEELTKKIAPLDRGLRLELSTIEMLKTGIGDLITGLDEAAQLEATNLFLANYERLKKPEQKALYLEILGYIHNPQAVIGLVGIAANAPKSEARVGALKALEKLGDYRGGKAAKFALEDENWQVRAAAIEAARRFASIDMIPALIQRLKKEEGRIRGDIISTLALLAGVSYSENVALWEKWWKSNEGELRSIVKSLKSESATENLVGMQKMEAQGFLLAARRILEKRGLTLARVTAEESRRLVDPNNKKDDKKKNDGPKEDADDEIIAIGKTIHDRDQAIRDAALKSFVLDPFDATWNPAKRRDLILLMGHVGGKKAIARLLGLAKKREESQRDDFERRMKRREQAGRLRAKWHYQENERISAFQALALCATGTDAVFKRLRAVFSEADADTEIMLAAIAALKKIDTSESVDALIDCLGEIASKSEDTRNKLSGVEKSITDALRTLTEQTWGELHDDWVAWWIKSKSDFKTASEKLAKDDPVAAAGGDREGGTRFYGIKTYSKRIVFILDISGSMEEPAEYGGGGKTKIQVAKEELLTAISSLPKDAKFNIMFYSTDFKVWQKKLVVANAKIKKAAKSYIVDATAGGGTNIYEPLVNVFDIAGRGSKDVGYGEVALDTIFFLSDGQPTAGRVTNTEDILNKVLSMNSLRKIKIHTIGVGKGHDREFMKRLAESSGGKYVAR